MSLHIDIAHYPLEVEIKKGGGRRCKKGKSCTLKASRDIWIGRKPENNPPCRQKTNREHHPLKSDGLIT